MEMTNKEDKIIQERKRWVTEVMKFFNCCNDTRVYRAVTHIKNNLKDKSLQELQCQRDMAIKELLGHDAP